MKKRDFRPAQLQESTVLVDNTAHNAANLAGSGYNIPGLAGTYYVGRSGLKLHPYNDEGYVRCMSSGLACKITDLDMDNARYVGSGSSGKVVVVQHKPSGAFVALKRINVSEERQLGEVRRELDTLYKEPGSPYVISCYGAFFERGHIMIALEKMDGSLLDCLKLNWCFPETVIRAITKQILLGLHYLHHDLSVVHRDLKPSNILFQANGKVKITDLGISTALQGETRETLTFVGTSTYMSPERLGGQGYSFPADIWSLGLTLIELCTTKNPYGFVNGEQSVIPLQPQQPLRTVAATPPKRRSCSPPLSDNQSPPTTPPTAPIVKTKPPKSLQADASLCLTAVDAEILQQEDEQAANLVTTPPTNNTTQCTFPKIHVTGPAATTSIACHGGDPCEDMNANGNNFWSIMKCVDCREYPCLPPNKIHSYNFQSFINKCVQHEPNNRLPVHKLLEHPFVSEIDADEAVDLCAEWFMKVVRQMEYNKRTLEHYKAKRKKEVEAAVCKPHKNSKNSNMSLAEIVDMVLHNTKIAKRKRK